MAIPLFIGAIVSGGGATINVSNHSNSRTHSTASPSDSYCYAGIEVKNDGHFWRTSRTATTSGIPTELSEYSGEWIIPQDVSAFVNLYKVKATKTAGAATILGDSTGVFLDCSTTRHWYIQSVVTGTGTDDDTATLTLDFSIDGSTVLASCDITLTTHAEVS